MELQDLPAEILLHIFSYCDSECLLNCRTLAEDIQDLRLLNLTQDRFSQLPKIRLNGIQYLYPEMYHNPKLLEQFFSSPYTENNMDYLIDTATKHFAQVKTLTRLNWCFVYKSMHNAISRITHNLHRETDHSTSQIQRTVSELAGNSSWNAAGIQNRIAMTEAAQVSEVETKIREYYLNLQGPSTDSEKKLKSYQVAECMYYLHISPEYINNIISVSHYRDEDWWCNRKDVLENRKIILSDTNNPLVRQFHLLFN